VRTWDRLFAEVGSAAAKSQRFGLGSSHRTAYVCIMYLHDGQESFSTGELHMSCVYRSQYLARAGWLGCIVAQ
jgi:hypothetical protein